MAKRKKSVKKSSMKKDMMMDNSCGMCVCKCKIGWMKLSAMAFILFIITVWPTVGNWLVGVHWGWYLGILVISWAFAWKHNCCNNCRK